MKLLSVSVAQPREVEINGRPFLTGIYKEPVTGRVRLRKLNLDGDGQADLTVHGGEHQAAYVYPIEHYAYWRTVLGRDTLPHGTFGENLTTSGLLETEVHVGDVFQIGDALVQVTIPRLPCFKFAHKMGRPQIVKEFRQSGFSGFYLRVLKEGMIGAGDDVTLLERDAAGITVRTVLGLYRLQEGTTEDLRRALAIPSLAPLLRDALQDRLAKLG